MAPEGQNFWDTFAGHLEKFKEDSKNLPPETVLRLTEHPSSKASTRILSSVRIGFFTNCLFFSGTVKKDGLNPAPVPEPASIPVRKLQRDCVIFLADSIV